MKEKERESLKRTHDVSSCGDASVGTADPTVVNTVGYEPPSICPSPVKVVKPRKMARLDHTTTSSKQPLSSEQKELVDLKQKSFTIAYQQHLDNLLEYYFLSMGGNLLALEDWKKNPSTQFTNFLQSCDDLNPGNLIKKSGIVEEGMSHSLLLSGVGQPSDRERQRDASRRQSPSRYHRKLSHSPADDMEWVDDDDDEEEDDDDIEWFVPLGPDATSVEWAQREHTVKQRILELRKSGKWSLSRLPKVAEPPRYKVHWDYLLEEMNWISADFAKERQWKIRAARKISRAVLRYFSDLEGRKKRQERERELTKQRVAHQLARMVKEFWKEVARVADFKQQSRLEEKRRKALDIQLDLIVDQTEKYSTWLSQGMGPAASGASAGSPSGTSSAASNSATVEGDDEFLPNNLSDRDDEETIDIEEQDLDMDHQQQEVAALKKESELPYEDFLQSLPPEMLQAQLPLPSPTHTVSSSETAASGESDKEFEDADASEDDEETIQEQERQEEKSEDKAAELQDLQKEGEMSIEEIVAKYGGAYDQDNPASWKGSDSSPSLSEEDEDMESADEHSSSSSSSEEEEVEEDVGVEILLGDDGEPLNKEQTNNEINDIAEEAAKFKPTGFTLETTQVQTQIPELLKHTLREYQHVGLDWLATLYDKKLNGILADEMGLGKTIQTIALVSHLACDKGNWGPHLIIVPTSVMLNWELEFKKWAPGFKVLTYFGNVKDRKMKRQGWTKPNAFHVCITSYKLVIQDHQSFRRKKWKYLILDEAQNIKNFKSQRWQMLLNFSTTRRLLLTGTPLQNNLMELWSLMHFLMPTVFQSHEDFKEWFSNPLTGMIEGTKECNENIVRRLHKVLRPFLLRRLKKNVEKQMPQKYEHVIMCNLSKRQRFLYDDFMSRKRTKDTLAAGHFLSVIDILMQLRKVCNHPDLFEPRPIVSPLEMDGIPFQTAGVVLRALGYKPKETVSLECLSPSFVDLEYSMTAFGAERVRELMTPRPVIEEVDSLSDPPDRPSRASLRTFFFKPTRSKANIVGASPMKSVFMEVPSVGASSLLAGRVPSTSLLHPTGQLTTVRSSPNVVALATAQSRGVGVTQPARVAMQPQRIIQVASTVQRGVGQNPIMFHARPAGGAPAVSQPITVQLQPANQGTVLQLMQMPSGQQVVAPVTHIQSVAGQSITTVNRASIVTNVTRAVPSTITTAARLTATVGLPTASTRPSVPTVATTSQRLHVNGEEGVKQAVLNGPGLSSDSMMEVDSEDEEMEESDVDDEAHARWIQELQEELSMETLVQQRKDERKATINRLCTLNERHCFQKPVYGQDLVAAVNVFDGKHAASRGPLACFNADWTRNPNKEPFLSTQTTALADCIKTNADWFNELDEVLDRYAFVTPAAVSPGVRLTGSQPHPSERNSMDQLRDEVKKATAPLDVLHPLEMKMSVQFPERRLIQYDCGKLQRLEGMLSELKTGGHRVLIFTQMTKMLNVLESFLNYHGHRYVRLDGSTKVEQRQILMDRFNQDKRIFVFILSTRSGGLGVNLTGADTVIFYDSDWNPTMDAQAQDRCHRIGQTRDVHIYRLVSAQTIEENILKKANQKRMLCDMAIEGGNFTTAHFKENTLVQLFAEPTGLADLQDSSQEKAAPVEMEVAEPTDAEEEMESVIPSQAAPRPVYRNAGMFEQALSKVEDESDTHAAVVAKAEETAELAEFDESIPIVETDNPAGSLERELAVFTSSLSSVEKYAVKFVESHDTNFAEEMASHSLDVEEAKREFELAQLKARREQEKREAEEEDDDIILTYPRELANQIFVDERTGEVMPVWLPPSPPFIGSEIYNDLTLIGYETTPMEESELPPIYVKPDKKGKRSETGRKKSRGDDGVPIPRSLFDRPSTTLMKGRRDLRLANHNLRHKAQQLPLGYRAQQTLPGPRPNPDGPPDQPEWLIHEDWALLQAVSNVLELPISLVTLSPAQVPNWFLVALVVNGSSRTYRSPRQCKLRFENHLVPREEGRVTYDVSPRKATKKATKGLYKTKNNRQAKTSQMYQTDNGSSASTLHAFRFDSIKRVASKREPGPRPQLVNPTRKNPKHTAVLNESGINFDMPLLPQQVAAIRQDRVTKEKQRPTVGVTQADTGHHAAPVVTAAGSQQQAHAAQRAAVVGGTSAVRQVPSAAGTHGLPLQGGHPSLQVQQLKPGPSAGQTVLVSTAPLSKAGSLSIPRTGGSSIVVNAPGVSQSFAAINKRVSLAASGAAIQSTLTTVASGQAHMVRSRGTPGVQEITALTAPAGTKIPSSLTATQLAQLQGQQQYTIADGKTPIMTPGNITPAQLARIRQAGQQVTVQQQPSLTLGPGQKAYIPQQQFQLLKHQQQQQQKAAVIQKSRVVQGLQVSKTGGSVAAAVTPGAGKQQLSEQDLTMIKKRYQQQQQQTQQNLLSKQQQQHHQLNAQLLAQHQGGVPVGSASATQVTTIVKTVSGAPTGTSMTLPGAGQPGLASLGINVALPHKTATGTGPAQMGAGSKALESVRILQQQPGKVGPGTTIQPSVAQLHQILNRQQIINAPPHVIVTQHAGGATPVSLAGIRGTNQSPVAILGPGAQSNMTVTLPRSSMVTSGSSTSLVTPQTISATVSGAAAASGVMHRTGLPQQVQRVSLGGPLGAAHPTALRTVVSQHGTAPSAVRPVMVQGGSVAPPIVSITVPQAANPTAGAGETGVPSAMEESELVSVVEDGSAKPNYIMRPRNPSK